MNNIFNRIALILLVYLSYLLISAILIIKNANVIIGIIVLAIISLVSILILGICIVLIVSQWKNTGILSIAPLIIFILVIIYVLRGPSDIVYLYDKLNFNRHFHDYATVASEIALSNEKSGKYILKSELKYLTSDGEVFVDRSKDSSHVKFYIRISNGKSTYYVYSSNGKLISHDYPYSEIRRLRTGWFYISEYE